jgi:RNA polymerase sigma-32 factor
LGTYAWYWIEARIKEFILRNWRQVNLGVSSLAKKLFFGYRKTLASLAGEGPQVPSVSEIATSMGVSEDEARLARTYFMGGDVALFDEQDADDAFPGPIPTQLTASDPAPDMLLQAQQRQDLGAQLPALLAQLPARQSQVLSQRYLSQPARTLSSLAQEWGVSIERVRQVEKQALVSMRKRLPAS